MAGTAATAPASTAWKTWCRDVQTETCRISERYRDLYSRRGGLAHYLAVAEILEERFGDPALTRAGFLHGVETDDLQRLPPGRVDEEVTSILVERERFWSLDLRTPFLLAKLRSEVLPWIHDARSTVLFVLEQLHHLDPTGEISRWTATFHNRPGELPADFPEGPSYLQGEWTEERLASFFRNVVAPTGKFFGLRHERSVIEDAVLRFVNRRRFSELLDFARRESEEDGECARLVRLVEETLRDSGASVEVRWEWRHIGSIDRKLGTKPISWRRQIHRAGFVTVVCPDARACYLVLHDLHERFACRPTELRDLIGEATPDGYRAIHTVLISDPASGVEAEAIAVRLVPGESIPQRLEVSGRRQLEAVGRRLDTADALELRVLTPDGLSIGLPSGSTVLNFAYALNKKWVAHLAGATVNREPVDVLHPLQPGDIVWLKIGDSAQPLPNGWAKRVPPFTVSKIRRMFRQYYGPELQRQGRQWLREQLLELGVEAPEEDQELDDYFEETIAQSKHFPAHRPPSSRWLLTQVGVLAAELRGDEPEFRGRLNEIVVHKIVNTMAHLIHTTKTITVHDLWLPDKLETRLSHVVVCDTCKPSRNEHMVGAIDEGGTLTLHVIDAPCAGANSFPLSRIRRTSRPQFFVVQTTNRLGVAAEILGVFYEQKVNLLDIASIQLGPNWAIVRVQTGYINSRKIDAITRGLKGIRGTTRIVGPNDRRVDALEAQLPPRRTFSAASWRKPAPYYCGNDISDDAYFYGMDEEMGTLRRAWEETSDPAFGRGKAVWILGPRRVGKTSLIQAFLRELARTSFFPCATVYFEAAEGQTWSEAEREIGRTLIRQASILAETDGRALEIPGSWDLPCLVDAVRGAIHCRVVLVIDEAVGLLAGTHGAGESKLVQKFRTEMQKRSGMLVVWVGPEAPARYLDTAVGQILQKAESLKVEPLTRAAIAELLRAKKLTPRYDIELPRHVLDEIFDMTAGNPFWVSHLGREMWKQASRGQEGRIRYTKDILHNAQAAVFELRVPFLDRVRMERPDRAALGLKVLNILAGSGSRRRRLPTFELAEIRRRLDTETRPSAAELLDILENLQAAGSTVSLSQDNGRHWRISSPMLADYLCYTGLDMGTFSP